MNYTSQECPHHTGYACIDHRMPHLRDPERRLPKPQRQRGNQWRVAQMLAVVLDEPHDDPSFPGDVRLEQARQLLSAWNNAQGSVLGMLREVINLKCGFCVRCPELPCSRCGRTGDEELIV